MQWAARETDWPVHTISLRGHVCYNKEQQVPLQTAGAITVTPHDHCWQMDWPWGKCSARSAAVSTERGENQARSYPGPSVHPVLI